MKRIYLLTIFLLARLSFAGGQVTFNKHYEEINGKGRSVLQTNDGGYIVAGEKSNGPHVKDMFLLKTDQYGETIWLKHFGSDAYEAAYSILESSDGGYIIAGYTSYLPFTTLEDIYLVKTNANGDFIGEKIYGGSQREIAYSIGNTSNNGYIISGFTDSYGSGSHDVYLLRTDGLGDTLWTKTFGGTKKDEGFSVLETTDGGFLVAGYTESFGAGGKDFYLIKTNSSGNTSWTKVYGGISDELAYIVKQTNDGGYIATGYTESYGAGTQNIYIIKINDTGDTLWTKVHGQPGRYCVAYDINQTNDGGYIISGMITTASPNGDSDLYVLKINSTGGFTWDREFKIEPTNTVQTASRGHSIQQTIDGGYIIAGYWFSGIKFELLMVKTKENGTVGIKEKSSLHNNYNIYPNPISNTATLEFNNPKREEHTLTIFDIQGRLVNIRTDIKTEQIKINKSGLPRGLYLIQLRSENHIRFIGKLMIE